MGSCRQPRAHPARGVTLGAAAPGSAFAPRSSGCRPGRAPRASGRSFAPPPLRPGAGDPGAEAAALSGRGRPPVPLSLGPAPERRCAAGRGRWPRTTASRAPRAPGRPAGGVARRRRRPGRHFRRVSGWGRGAERSPPPPRRPETQRPSAGPGSSAAAAPAGRAAPPHEPCPRPASRPRRPASAMGNAATAKKGNEIESGE